MASITRRQKTRKDGTTYVTFRARYRDPARPASENANIERVFSQIDCGGIARARKAAEQWLAEQTQAIATGTWIDPRQPPAPEPGSITLREVAESWRATWSLVGLRLKTQLNYANILDHRILPTWGDRRVASITPPTIQRWVNELDKERSAQTVRNSYNVLRVVLRHAVKQGHIQVNPCASENIDLPSRRRRTTSDGGNAAGVAMTPAELRDLIAALPSHWRTPTTLAAMTGLRAAELWGLTRANWDPDTGTITVRQTLSDVGGNVIAGHPKTDASKRTLHIPTPLHAALTHAATTPGVEVKTVKAGQPRGYPAITDTPSGPGPTLTYVPDPDDRTRLLFTTPSGHPVQHSNFYRRIYRPTAAALWPAPHRLANARFHDIRHSVATQLLHATGNATDVMKRLGHSQLATTTDLYGRHAHEEADRRLAELTGAAWSTPDELAARRQTKRGA
jgi:integrase